MSISPVLATYCLSHIEYFFFTGADNKIDKNYANANDVSDYTKGLLRKSVY